MPVENADEVGCIPHPNTITSRLPPPDLPHRTSHSSSGFVRSRTKRCCSAGRHPATCCASAVAITLCITNPIKGASLCRLLSPKRSTTQSRRPWLRPPTPLLPLPRGRLLTHLRAHMGRRRSMRVGSTPRSTCIYVRSARPRSCAALRRTPIVWFRSLSLSSCVCKSRLRGGRQAIANRFPRQRRRCGPAAQLLTPRCWAGAPLCGAFVLHPRERH